MVKLGKVFYQWIHFNPSANTSWYNVVYPTSVLALFLFVVLGVVAYYFWITKNTVKFVNKPSYLIIMSAFGGIFGLLTLLFAISKRGIGLGDVGIYTFWIINTVYYIIFFFLLSLIVKPFSRNSKYIPF
jgi:hypothetical protein